MLDAFTLVQRRPQPPRQKPYLPASSDSPISDAPDDTGARSVQRAPVSSPRASGQRISRTPETPLDVFEPSVDDLGAQSPTERDRPPGMERAQADAADPAPSTPAAKNARRKPYLPNAEEPQPPPRRAAPTPPAPAPAAASPTVQRMLGALDLPADTPVEGQWSGASAPISTAAGAPIQRTANAGDPEITAEAPDDTPQEVDPGTIEHLAQRVYRVLKNRLRSDRERKYL